MKRYTVRRKQIKRRQTRKKSKRGRSKVKVKRRVNVKHTRKPSKQRRRYTRKKRGGSEGTGENLFSFDNVDINNLYDKIIDLNNNYIIETASRQVNLNDKNRTQLIESITDIKKHIKPEKDTASNANDGDKQTHKEVSNAISYFKNNLEYAMEKIYDLINNDTEPRWKKFFDTPSSGKIKCEQKCIDKYNNEKFTYEELESVILENLPDTEYNIMKNEGKFIDIENVKKYHKAFMYFHDSFKNVYIKNSSFENVDIKRYNNILKLYIPQPITEFSTENVEFLMKSNDILDILFPED